MSTIKVNTIQNTSGVQQYLARAWVNFNGTGTIAIRASGNVSSITDLGTGYYLVTYSSALGSSSYSTTSGGLRKDNNSVENAPNVGYDYTANYLSGSMRARTYDNNTDGLQDVVMLCLHMVTG